MGSCCSEMDIWEANSISTAYTPHPCTTVGQHMCTGDSCGGTYSDDRYGGTCDPDGCDFNSYRQGDLEFYGPGMTVDTNKVMTVVTQFIEEGGQLSAIRRFYVQDGTVIPNSESLIEGNPGSELNDEFCKAQKVAFGDDDVFNDKGGFAQFTDAVAGGMVLVMSLWDDHYANMLWLDSTYPTDASPDEPGKGRGSCPTDSGVPEEVEASQKDDQVTFSYVHPCSGYTEVALANNCAGTSSLAPSARPSTCPPKLVKREESGRSGIDRRRSAGLAFRSKAFFCKRARVKLSRVDTQYTDCDEDIHESNGDGSTAG